MLRSLRLVNIVLSLGAALIAAALTKTWIAPVAPSLNPAVARPLQEVETLDYNPTARPPLAQFDALLEKNPFKQPPPVAARPFGAPAPLPLPVLVGTILVDHDHRAVLSDKGKANIYTIGQEVAGGVITEIKADRIVFKRGDTMREIILKAAIESAAAAPAQASAPVATQAGVPAQSSEPSQPPSEVPDSEEAQRRREERLMERRERLEMQKAARRGMR